MTFSVSAQAILVIFYDLDFRITISMSIHHSWIVHMWFDQENNVKEETILVSIFLLNIFLIFFSLTININCFILVLKVFI